MIEKAAEHDDDLMHKYIEGQEPTVEEIKKAIRKATIAIKLTPVIVGSALKNKGVQHLLDAVVDYLPAPSDLPSIKGIQEGGETEIERHPGGSRRRPLHFQIQNLCLAQGVQP